VALVCETELEDGIAPAAGAESTPSS